MLSVQFKSETSAALPVKVREATIHRRFPARRQRVNVRPRVPSNGRLVPGRCRLMAWLDVTRPEHSSGGTRRQEGVLHVHPRNFSARIVSQRFVEQWDHHRQRNIVTNPNRFLAATVLPLWVFVDRGAYHDANRDPALPAS